MHAQALLATLIFNHPPQESAEGLARLFGMVHLYRTSGLHFLAFFTFLEIVFRHFFQALKIPVKQSRVISLFLCLVSIFWIWHLQAFRPSLLRPIATFLLRLYFQNRGALTRIFLPLLLTVLVEWAAMGNPFTAAGALHYYTAVAGGLLAWERVRERNPFIQHLVLALGSWLPLAGYDLYHDHLVSYLTPVYSLLSLPVITCFLYPLTLVSLLFQPQIPEWILHLWDLFLNLLWQFPEHGLSFATISAEAATVSAFLSLVLCFFWTYGLQNPSKKLFPIVLCIALFLLRLGLSHFSEIRTQVVQLDVGQGDSALLQKGGRTEFIDVGSARTLKIEDWLRKLSRYDIHRIDGILLSHLDEDHVGGLKHLLAAVPIGCVQTHPTLFHSERGLRLIEEINGLSPNTLVQVDQCMKLVEPQWFASTSASAHGNELMGGEVFELDSKTAYFALGDGDQEQEREYGRIFKDLILGHAKRIWKVSHHGSKFSSDPGFLRFIGAQEFWISDGKRNRYHHPHPLTLLRLNSLPGIIHRTDVEGDLISRAE